jgi:molecular chaperone HtpG
MEEGMTGIFSKASESYARLNKYFMGEIHVQDPNVIPNARRDGFEDGPEWLNIQKALVEFARERSREAYQLSQARNLDIERLVGAADKERETATKKLHTGLASNEEKEKVLEKLDKQIAKLEAAKKADRSAQERNEIDRARRDLQKSRDTVENETHYIAQNLNSALDKKQRKVISEIIRLLYDILDEDSFEKARNAIMKRFQMRDEEGK